MPGSSDTPQTPTTPDEEIWSEMQEAFWGAYDAAPRGEGVMGASDFGCKAVILVAKGMKAPEAVAKAIGEHGNYGVPRRYGLIPRPIEMQALRGSAVCMTFETNEQRDLAMMGVGSVKHEA